MFRITKIPATLRAVRHRNYRLFIIGQIISLIGSWMQSTAQGWLVYRLTRDAFLLGLVSFAAGVPTLALGLFAGVVVDRANRHRILVITQVLFLFQAFVMGVLTLIHNPHGEPIITFWHIALLSVFAGAVQAFDLPARQSFLIEMVPHEDLGNAIALNSLTFNAARVVGPSIAGLVIALLQRMDPNRSGFGEGMCFMLNAVSFLAVIFSLLRMNLSPGAVKRFKGSSEGYLMDGLKYVNTRPHIGALLLFVGMMALFGIPYIMLLPVFAKDVLHGDSRTFGYLTASVGIGAMIGGILLARREHMHGLTKVIAGTTFAFSIIVTVFAWMTDVRLACVTVALAGMCMVSAMISSQTVTQAFIAERYRGRVMSLYSMMAVGLYPFGCLIAGAEAKYFGPSTGLTINALICFATAAYYSMKLPRLRAAARATPEYQLIAGAR